MIKSIEIENFRCFHKTTAKGFGRVNLIGGKNNAGKTALLEALLLMGEPSIKNVVSLINSRRISINFIKTYPEKCWDNFFNNFDNKKSIELAFLTENENKGKTLINCNEDAKWLGNDEDKLVKIEEQKEATIKIVANGIENRHASFSIHANSFGMNNFYTEIPKGLTPTNYILSNYISSNIELASEFDKAKIQGLNQTLLEAFQIIDKSVTEVTTLSTGEPAIYLKRPNESYMPLTLFGDAMNKIADFILKIVNNKSSMILIDEIENGIHHENQCQIWKILFDLCNRFDVQLFATSHSAEMIEAFKDVVQENNFDGNYFRMAKHTVTEEINIQKISIDVLEDKIENHQPIRGELTT